MAAKRRRRRARNKRAAASNPKKIRRKKRHNPTTARAAAANPRRRRKRRNSGVRVRAAVGNPRKRRHARRRVGNPRRHSSKRRHRKNPGIPAFAMAGLAMLAGLGAYVVANAGSYALTQKIDPTMNTLIRNRRLAGGLAALGGLAAAFFGMPLVGVAVAAGGLVTLGGTEATVQVTKLLQPKPQATTAGIGAVDRMGAVNQLPAAAANVVPFMPAGLRRAYG